LNASHYALNVEKYIQRNITMTWYLNQGAEISIPSTYNNENIFLLPVTYNVIKKTPVAF
jgi:hypothetical protein